MTARRTMSAAVALALLLPALARAEDAGMRSVFAYGAGNRALALGGAFSAIADDPSAPLWNPGGLGFIPRKQVLATGASLYGLDVHETFAGLVFPDWRLGTVGLTFRHLGVGGIEARDDRNGVTDAEFSNTQVEIGLAYGRRITEAVSVGATFKMEQQTLAGFRGSAFRLDLGGLAYPGLLFAPDAVWSRRLGVGGSFRNLLESPLQLDQERVADPTTLRTGLSYRVPVGPTRSALLAMDLEGGPNVDTGLHAGLEFEIHPMLALRSGLSAGGFTAGAGLTWRDLAFDYVFEENSLGNVHRFGFSVGFGATVEESRLASLRAEDERVAARLEQAFAAREAARVEELVVQAESARAGGQLDDALDLLSAASTLIPEHSQVKELRVQCLREKAGSLELDGRFAEAAVIYGRIHAVAPGDSLALDSAVRCREESDRRAARSQEMQSLFAAALDAFSAGDLATARGGFRKILELEPDDREAAAILRRTDETIADRVEGLLEQTSRLIRAGSFDDAEAALAEARGFGVSEPAIRRAEASLAAARKARSGPPPPTGTAARSDRPRTTRLSPEASRELENLYKRGVAAMEKGRGDDALRYWELAASIDPDYQQLRDYLKREYLMRGMDAFAAGRLDDAVDYWEKALKLDPSDDKAKGYLARARQQQTRTREIFGGSGQ